MKKIFLFLISVVLLFSFTSCHYYTTNKLIKAIEEENIQEITEILDSGIDLNRPDFTCPFIHAFSENSANVPLSFACRTGNLEIVELLISHGATAAYIEGTGWSPLSETLFYYQPDDIEIVKLLLENGADITHEQWGLPVEMASRMTPKVFDAQKTNGTCFCTEYDEETAQGITEIVKLLMGDFDINDQTDAQTTLLMNAASVGNYALAEYLLSIGADPSLRDYNDKTAYDLAVENGHDNVASLLAEQKN